MAVVVPRYAEALMRATRPDEIDSVGKALTEFTAYVAETPALRDLLLNPAISAKVRKETVRRLLPDNAPETVARFLLLLIDRKRLKMLPAISDAYAALADRAQNRIEIRVTTARPLSDTQLTQLQHYYLKRHKARSAVLRQETDESLIGGFRVQVGDKITYYTLRARLDALRDAIINNA